VRGSIESGSRPRLPAALRLAGVVAIFALAGPPIGGLVAWATMGAQSMRSPVPFVGGSYGEGMVLALATGLMVAIASWVGARSWLVAVAAALLANIAFHLGTMTPGLTGSEFFAAVWRVAGVFLPASIVAAIVCWAVALPLLRKS
jgi:hypothetical protein